MATFDCTSANRTPLPDGALLIDCGASMSETGESFQLQLVNDVPLPGEGVRLPVKLVTRNGHLLDAAHLPTLDGASITSISSVVLRGTLFGEAAKVAVERTLKGATGDLFDISVSIEGGVAGDASTVDIYNIADTLPPDTLSVVATCTGGPMAPLRIAASLAIAAPATGEEGGGLTFAVPLEFELPFLETSLPDDVDYSIWDAVNEQAAEKDISIPEDADIRNIILCAIDDAGTRRELTEEERRLPLSVLAASLEGARSSLGLEATCIDVQVLVFVKTVTGKQIAIEHSLMGSVREFKAKIHRREGIYPGEQVLKYEGVQLEDSCSFTDYGIQNDSIILLLPAAGGVTTTVRRSRTAQTARKSTGGKAPRRFVGGGGAHAPLHGRGTSRAVAKRSRVSAGAGSAASSAGKVARAGDVSAPVSLDVDAALDAASSVIACQSASGSFSISAALAVALASFLGVAGCDAAAQLAALTAAVARVEVAANIPSSVHADVATTLLVIALLRKHAASAAAVLARFEQRSIAWIVSALGDYSKDAPMALERAAEAV